MRKARLSRSAARYIRRQVTYVAERNPTAARKIKKRLDEVRVLLSEHPNAGEASVVPGFRQFVDARYGYVISYRLARGEAEVASIRHGRQQPTMDLVADDTDDDDLANSPKPW